MLREEMDVMEYMVDAETRIFDEYFEAEEAALYEIEEKNLDIDGNRKPIFFRGVFTTIDPFWESELNDEVWGTTFEQMLSNFHKAVEYHTRTAKVYKHITPEKAARLAYETLEIIEYYE